MSDTQKARLHSGTAIKDVLARGPLNRLVASSRQNYALMKGFAKVGYTPDPPNRHQAVKYALQGNQADIPKALKDPRYIAYCKKQDRKDRKPQPPTVLWGTPLFRELYYSPEIQHILHVLINPVPCGIDIPDKSP